MRSFLQQCRLYRPFLWVVSSALLLRIAAPAQQFAANELTAGADLQTYGEQSCEPIGSTGLCSPSVDHYAFPAPSIVYTHNLSPSLALEGVISPPAASVGAISLPADRQTLALGGVKTGWRGKRWGAYGRIDAGVASYSCGLYGSSSLSAPPACTRVTDFAMEYGGAVEYHLTPHWGLRLDAAHLLVLAFDRVLYRSPDGVFTDFIAGATQQHFDARLGITRSFGALHDAQVERVPRKSAWDAGLLFALQPRTQPESMMMNAYPALGAWSSWNFSGHLSLDTALMHSGRNSGQAFADYQAGGRAFEALTGLKIGIRRDHMGYFGKVRGGTITFGKTLRQVDGNSNGITNIDLGMFTNPVLDVGGVLEVYPSRHSVLRCDAGSATIFYQPKNVIYLGQTIPISGQTQTTMMMSFGGGFRF